MREDAGAQVGREAVDQALELHDQLDEVERVRVQVLLERGLLGDFALVDSELFGQDFLDALEDFFPRSCHVTSLAGRGQVVRPADANTPPRASRSPRRSTRR